MARYNAMFWLRLWNYCNAVVMVTSFGMDASNTHVSEHARRHAFAHSTDRCFLFNEACAIAVPHIAILTPLNHIETRCSITYVSIAPILIVSNS